MPARSLVGGNNANCEPEKCPLLKQGRPARHKAGLPGEPQQGHQDEEDTSHDLGIAGTFRKHKKAVKGRLSCAYGRLITQEDAPDRPQFGILLLDPSLRHHLSLGFALLAHRASFPKAEHTRLAETLPRKSHLVRDAGIINAQ